MKRSGLVEDFKLDLGHPLAGEADLAVGSARHVDDAALGPGMSAAR